MTKPDVLGNQAPADKLKTIREEISRLKGDEDYIRRMILSGKFEKVGDEYEVVVSPQIRKVFDRAAAEVELGDLSRFDTEKEFVVLRIKAREKEEEPS